MSKISTLKMPIMEGEDALRLRLTQEFLAPAEGNQQPLFHFSQPGHKTHILVIWDEWKSLPMQDRCRIALEAYEEAFGEEKMLNVSASLGLTADEAKRLGYDY